MAAPKFKKEDVRAFLDRPWAELAEMKERYWANAHAADPRATQRASADMWNVLHHAGLVDDEQLRDDDLAAHVKLRALLDRAGRALEARRGPTR